MREKYAECTDKSYKFQATLSPKLRRAWQSEWLVYLVIALDALNWLNYEAIDYNFIAIVWKSPASISMVKADQIVVR